MGYGVWGKKVLGLTEKRFEGLGYRFWTKLLKSLRIKWDDLGIEFWAQGRVLGCTAEGFKRALGYKL